MKVLGIVPARAGSKGVPGKNIRLLHGKPLLQYTAEAALGAKRLDRVILSTDDEAIAQVGRSCGLEVPFLRPPELAGDSVPTLPVIEHVLDWLEKSEGKADAICLLQPTNPLRSAALIDACIAEFIESNADTLITVCEVPAEYNPHWVYLEDTRGNLYLSTGEDVPIPRRQELPAAYHREGSIYVVKSDVIRKSGTLYGEKIIGHKVKGPTVNIDTFEDWEAAEKVLGKPD